MTTVGGRASTDATVAHVMLRLGDLPSWLRDASDPTQVATSLIAAIPELLSGTLELLACDVRRMRFRQDTWVGTYRIDLEEAASGRTSRVNLRAELVPPGRPLPEASAGPSRPFGAEGSSMVLPELRVGIMAEPPDALPALGVLTDPEGARALLQRAITQGSRHYAGIRIVSCSPEVMRYNPGSRCTVRYRLELPPEQQSAWPAMVVAKTHHGGKGANAYKGMCALWSSPLGRSTVVRIAEPLAFIPEDNVLVQGPVPGSRTLEDLLKELLRSPGQLDRPAFERIRGVVSKVALGLAELHGCGVSLGETVAWADVLAEIGDRLVRLAAVAPVLEDAVEPLLATLVVTSEDNPADPAVPSHGTFRPAQVLLHGDEIGFIDFDGFCQAEPAMDVALFRATLRDRGLRALPKSTLANTSARRRGFEVIDELCDVFLEAYESAAPLSRRRVALWEGLELLSLVLGCWTKAKVELLDDRLELLRRHLVASGLR